MHINKKKALKIILTLIFLTFIVDFKIIRFNINNFSQNLTTAEVGLLLSFLIFPFFYKKEKIMEFFKLNKTYIILTILFIFSSLISLIFSPLFNIEKMYLIKIFLRYLLIFLFVWNLSLIIYIYKDLKIFWIKMIVFLAAIIGGFSIIENYSLKISLFLSNVFREGNNTFLNNKIRPAFTFAHANIFGCFMAISAIITLYLLNIKLISKKTYFVIIISVFIGIILSGSRNAMYSTLVGLTIMLFSRKNMKIVIITFLIYFMTYFSFSLSKSRIFDFYSSPEIFWNKKDYEETSIMSRFLLWNNAIKMFEDYPIAGVGPGGYNKMLKFYMEDKLKKIEPSETKKETLNAHNGFLNILAEYGIIGVIIVFVFLFVYLKNFLKPLNSQNISKLAIILAIFFQFIPDAFFYNYFYMLFVLTILFLLISYNREKQINE